MRDQKAPKKRRRGCFPARFGKDGGKRLADEYDIPFLGQIPLVQGIREGGDAGKPAVLSEEMITKEAFMNIAQNAARQVAIRNEMLGPTQVVKMMQ